MARRSIKEVSDDLDKLDTKLDLIRGATVDLELKLALLHQRTQIVEDDINGVLGSFTWAGRIVVGVILTAITGFIIAGGLSK